MKRILLFIGILLPFCGLSQNQKGDFSIEIDENYSKDHVGFGPLFENRVFSLETDENNMLGFAIYDSHFNQPNYKIKGGNFSAGLSYYLLNNFSIGLGLEYGYGKTNNRQTVAIDNLVAVQDLRADNKVILIKLFSRYQFKIIEKFYLNTYLQLSSGNIKTDWTKTQATAQYLDNDLTLNDTRTTTSKLVTTGELDDNYYIYRLHPEFEYFISSDLSVTLKTGGFYYSDIAGKNSNSQHEFNFNPQNWVLGLKIKL